MAQSRKAEPRWMRSLRWIAAAVLVVALHGGAAFALLQRPDELSTDVAGAIAIEMAPFASAAEIKPTDVAPGPLMPEEASATEAREETKRPVVEEVPKVDPSPLAPQPAALLPPREPDTKEKPKEEDNDKVTAEKDSRQATAAPLTTAPTASDAAPKEISAAPAPGLSPLAARLRANWQMSLAAQINRYKRYPHEARIHKIEGVVRIEFSLDRRGNIVEATIVSSSGSALLDEEALAMLRRAAPLPAPPNQVPVADYHLAVPIQFRMQ